MAGPLDIQRPARGLVDLLGLRALGDSPHVMADSVAGTLDLLDMYLIDRRTSAQTATTVAVSGVSSVAFNSLPALNAPAPGTALLLYSLTLEYQTPGASTWSGSVMIQRAAYDGTRGLTWCFGLDRTAAAGELVYTGVYWPKPMLFLPGDSLILVTRVFTGTGSFAALYADYAKVSV